MPEFIKTTIRGGVLFLIPVIILVAVFKQAHQLIGKIAGPIFAHVPVERVVGIAVLDLLTLAVVLLVCFLAGLAAKTRAATRFVSSLETEFLSKIPAYDLAKTKLTGQLRFEEAEDLHPVLARFDDQWQIGFEVERITGGKVVIYVPGAPDPWSGAVTILTDDRVTRLGSKLTAALGIFKSLGKGASPEVQHYLQKG
jgi:uncharacterized membrane protein